MDIIAIECEKGKKMLRKKIIEPFTELFYKLILKG